MDPTATTLSTVNTVQSVLSLLAALHLNAYKYPDAYEAKDGERFDYIIIGGGTAGSVVANRLTENSRTTVLVIEAGEDPTIETELPGLFPFTPASNYDYNFPSVNDNYTSQNLREKSVRLVSGKMLGGCSGLSHLLCFRGDPYDFQRWESASGSSSWNYESLLPYFIKSEKVMNQTILNSPSGKFHGTKGNVGVTIEHYEGNDDMIKAIEQMGYKLNIDLNSNDTFGVGEPFYFISDGKRSSTAEAYLSPAKNRRNLHVWKKATATKIIFDKKKNAVAVEVLNSKNKKVTVKSRKEIILAAGVVRSPQLLMLSGIGPKEHLESLNITVLSDLPVGSNLQDHVAAVMVHKLDDTDPDLPSRGVDQFPTPYILANKALDPSKSAPETQAINIYFPKNSDSVLIICAIILKYNNNICNQFYKANADRNILVTAVLKQRPESTGSVALNNTDPLANPVIRVGHYTNRKDLEDTADYLKDYSSIVNTDYFKSLNAEYFDIDLDKCNGIERNTTEYWQCYALQMSCSIWHFCGTNPLGTVLDSKLFVKGVTKIRVVDSSALPSIPGGDNMAALIAFAEKASDLIKKDQKGLSSLFG